MMQEKGAKAEMRAVMHAFHRWQEGVTEWRQREAVNQLTLESQNEYEVRGTEGERGGRGEREAQRGSRACV